MGALIGLLQSRFGLKTHTLINPVVAAVGVAAIQIARNNPDRVGFIMINLSANIVYISPVIGVLATSGIKLDANGGLVSFVWDEDFELVSSELFAIATGAASDVYILEVIGEKTYPAMESK